MANDINLAAMWIPVMPETSHLIGQLSKAGRAGKKAFLDGFKSSGGGADELGQSFAEQFSKAFTSGLARSGGLTSIFSSMTAEADSHTADRLRRALPGLTREYRSAIKDLTDAKEREASVTDKMNLARDNHLNKANLMIDLELKRQQAHEEATTAQERATVAQKNYTDATMAYNSATGSAFGNSKMFAGIMGGAVVASLQLVEQGFQELIHIGVDLFSDAIHSAETLTQDLIGIGEQYKQLSIQVTEFSGATGDALQDMQDHAQRVFGTLDVAGKDTGQVMSELGTRLNTGPGAALDKLTQHVVDLQGRFSDLKAQDIASVFTAFGVPAAQADSVLSSVLQTARRTGVDMGGIFQGLAGGTSEVLKRAGLNAEQSANLVAQMEKQGINGQQAGASLQKAMKEFQKEGLSFAQGMDLLSKAAANATPEQRDQIAEKFFGQRSWAVASVAVQSYYDTVKGGANAFDAPVSAIDDFLQQTQTLENEIEELRHQFEDAFHGVGTAVVDFAEHGLSSITAWFEAHHDDVIGKIKQYGDEFIDALPKIKEFVVTGMQLLGAFVASLAPLGILLGQAAADMLIITGHLHDGLELMKHAPAFGQAFVDAGKALETGADKLDQWNMKAGSIRDAFDAALGSATSIAQVGADGGFTGGTGLPGSNASTGGMPGITPGSNTAGLGAGGAIGGALGGGGGSTVGGAGSAPGAIKAAMQNRIVQEGKQYGLTDVEIGMILADGQLESQYQGPGYMGFGPEANAQGINFGSNPLGAVDQFFKQFMERRSAEGDPNNPQAVAEYIWHTVQAAADPNYLNKLLGVYSSGAQHFDTGGFVGPSIVSSDHSKFIRDDHNALQHRLGRGYNTIMDLPIISYFHDMVSFPHMLKLAKETNEKGYGHLAKHVAVEHGKDTVRDQIMEFLESTFGEIGAAAEEGMETAPKFAKGGPSGTDTIPAWLTPGEFVWNTEAVKKYGWLISMLNGAAHFQGGGFAPGATDNATSGSPQFGGMPGMPSGAGEDIVDWLKSVVAQFNAAYGTQLTVTADYPGGPLGHPKDAGDHGVYRAIDISAPGNNQQQMDAFANWWVHNPQMLAATRQLIHNDPTGGFASGMNVIGGHFTEGSQTYANAPWAGHIDHVHLAVQYIPGATSPGSTMMLGNGGVAWGGQFPANIGGPNQISADQYASDQEAIQSAKDRQSDLNWDVQQANKRVNDLQKELNDTMHPTDGTLVPDQAKIKQINDQLAEALHQRDRAERDATEQTQKVTDAQRKLSEDMAGKHKSSDHGESGAESAEKAFGSSFLSGIADSLGLSNLGLKPPWEFGSVKLGLGVLNWAAGTAQAAQRAHSQGISNDFFDAGAPTGSGGFLQNVPNFNLFGGPLGQPPGPSQLPKLPHANIFGGSFGNMPGPTITNPYATAQNPGQAAAEGATAPASATQSSVTHHVYNAPLNVINVNGGGGDPIGTVAAIRHVTNGSNWTKSMVAAPGAVPH